MVQKQTIEQYTANYDKWLMKMLIQNGTDPMRPQKEYIAVAVGKGHMKFVGLGGSAVMSHVVITPTGLAYLKARS